MMRALAPRLSPLNRTALANEWLFSPLLKQKLAGNPLAMALMGTTVERHHSRSQGSLTPLATAPSTILASQGISSSSFFLAQALRSASDSVRVNPHMSTEMRINCSW